MISRTTKFAAAAAALVGVLVGLVWPTQDTPGAQENPVASRILRQQSVSMGQGGAEPVLPSQQRIVTRSGARDVSDDPTLPNYDPRRLIQHKGWTVIEIFDAEPRRPAFAVPREEFFREETARLLEERYPNAKVTEATCRSSSCKLVIESSSTDPEELYMFLQRPSWGTWMQPGFKSGKDGRALISIHVAFESSARDHSLYEAWFLDTLKKKRVLDDSVWDWGEGDGQ